MHAVLWHFVDAASGRFDLLAEEMIQRQTTFPNGIGFLDRFGYIDLGERRSLQQSSPGRQLCGKGGSERAAGPVKMIFVGLLTREQDQFGTIEKHVGGALHMATLDDHRT